MIANQIYALVNAVSKDMYGETALTVKDLSGLISLGNTVLSSSASKDLFLSTLVDRIGRTVVRSLDLDVNYPNILTDSFEFGAILQKLTISPMKASVAGNFNVGTMDADDVAEIMFSIDKPDAKQKLFSDVNVWNINLSLPDNLMKTAFTSAENMAVFVSAIISAFNDSMTLQLNNMNKFCVNNFIGEKIASGQNHIHLLTEFNGESGTMTADEAIKSADFLKYAGYRIMTTLAYMEEPTMLYNEGGEVRVTRRDNAHVFMLSEFEKSALTYLSADTWHDDYVRLPLHQNVNGWQAIGNIADASESVDFLAPNFTTASTIKLKTSSGSTVNQTGVICLIADRQALGTTIYDRRTSTDRLNRLDLTQYTNKMEIGYFNDLSENGCVFSIS